MVQAVWATAHGDPLEVTSLAGEQFVRLGAHFDPILVLFAPLWLVWPSPSLLVVVQAIVVALGALPVFWLARTYLDSERAALGFALAYLLLPAVQWMTLSEFHPVALATPFLLFALWYVDQGRLVPFAVFALLAVTTKEHVGLALAGLGLWHVASRRRLLPGAAVFAVGVGVAVLALGVVIPHFSPSGTSSFYGRYDGVGGSPGGIAETAITDPAVIAGAVSERRDAEYLAELVLPLAGLALLAPLALLVALPELGLNLLSATDTQTSIHFHYSATAIAGLVAASVFGAARLTRRRPGLAGPLALLAVAAALASNLVLGGSPAWRAFPGAEKLGARVADVEEHDRLAAGALRLIPADAVVSASNSLGGHLSERRRVLSFPLLADAEWIAVDETQPSDGDRIGARAAPAYAAAIMRVRRDSGWELVHDREGVLVFRRVDDS
jgi:uncharacterized membrane protein